MQLAKLLQVATRDAQSGARIQFKWNEQNRAEFISGKLLDASGKEQEIDPEKIYTIVTIDYLLRLGSGSYAILQEAKSTTPLNITLRDAIMEYVKVRDCGWTTDSSRYSTIALFRLDQVRRQRRSHDDEATNISHGFRSFWRHCSSVFREL